jgi:streptogramin lyase
MLKRKCGALVSMSVLMLLAVISAHAEAAQEKGRYIVVFEDSVEHPANFARAQTEERSGKLGFIFRDVLKGYSAELPEIAVEAIRRSPQVKYVVIDGEVFPLEELIETIDHEGVELFEHTIPTGISRTFASSNKALDIDGVDDVRANVDVAVIDTGVSHTHADLDVEARTDCSNGTEKEAACVNESGSDMNGHGTHVAGTIGAIDNSVGVVGMAPGARIWGVKVLGTGTNYFSEIIAGIEWITTRRKDANPENDIEVANMSLGCSAFSSFCPPKPLDEAITKSVEAGVVHVVAAGNSSSDAKNFTPANSPDVITVSALADYDGKTEGKGSATCSNYGLDDRLASFSNFGSTVEMAAPGVCILSTVPGGYGLKSGTSMASPHVAGAAAILAAQSPPEDKADVEAIGATIEAAGNLNWVDISGDGVKEPLLDVGNESTFSLQPAKAPENTGLPVLSPKTPFEGVPVSATTGSWVNKPTKYTFQWRRCNAAGAECTNIAGATKTSYTPVAADVAKTLRVVVTASNAGGEASATSEASNQVLPLGEVTEYSLPVGSKPTEITVGPDGNLWFINQATGKIGKFTPSGVLTEYKPTVVGTWLDGITSGPGGAVWYSIGSPFVAGKMTTAGVATDYTLAHGNPYSIAADNASQVWVTISSRKIAKIQANGTVSSYFQLPSDSTPSDITLGPENKMWFANTECGTTTPARCAIGSITNAGVVTEYNLTESVPRDVTMGPDGNTWFTSSYGSKSKVGKVTPAGFITQYLLPASSNPEGIIAGADGNLWFAQRSTSKIGRVTPAGAVQEFSLPAGSEPIGVTSGPGNYIWFTAKGTGRIGKIVP